MVEGGKIDWACHGNDAATVFNEVKDMDDAIKVAYEFYKKHPKETLIVVTADHETGGIVLGTGKYALNLKALQYQKHSADGLSRRISELRKSKGNKVTWEDMKEFLGEEMGFWKQFPISWEQEKKLRDEFEQSFVRNKVVFAESMYSKSEPMAARAKRSNGPDIYGRLGKRSVTLPVMCRYLLSVPVLNCSVRRLTIRKFRNG